VGGAPIQKGFLFRLSATSGTGGSLLRPGSRKLTARVLIVLTAAVLLVAIAYQFFRNAVPGGPPGSRSIIRPKGRSSRRNSGSELRVEGSDCRASVWKST